MSGLSMSQPSLARRFGGYIAGLVGAMAVGGMLVYTTKPLRVFLLVVGGMVGMAVLMEPFLGVLGYILITTLRIEEAVPALLNLHLARLLTAFLLAAWLVKLARQGERPDLTAPPLAVLYILFGLMAISVAPSVWPTRSFEAALDMLKILLFVVVFINLVQTEGRLRVFLWIWILAHAYLAATSVHYYLTDYQPGLSGRPRGSGSYLEDPNDFALALNLILPFAFHLLVTERRVLARAILLFCLSLFTVGIVATQSRGGLVALLVVGVGLGIANRRRVAVVGLLALCCLLILVVAGPEYWERQSSIITYQADASAQGRLVAWRAGLAMLADRPLTGVGLDGFSTAYGLRYGLDTREFRWIAPHNAYIQVAAELGIPGILCYLALMIWIVRLSGFADRRDPRLSHGSIPGSYVQETAKAIRVSLAAFAAGSFFLSAAYYPHLYYLAALSAVVAGIALRQAAAEEGGP